MTDIKEKAAALMEWFNPGGIFYPVLHLLFTPEWWQLLLCFLSCSFLMIFSLNAVEKNGFEGTLVGTLVMPYFSGFPNLCFAWLMARSNANGALVLENCLVNNVTNLTLIPALPAILWGLTLSHGKETLSPDMRISLLSLLLSILALGFFSLALFYMSKDGKLDAVDGTLLLGIFLFWQLFHVFEVLKNNTREKRRIKKRILFDLLIIGFCAWGIFSSIEGLIQWIFTHGTGFFSKSNLGLLSGLLMVVPNAFLALYYSAVHRSDIAYASQIGDCHICIPLCVGIFAVFSTIRVPANMETGIFIIMGAAAGHFFFLAFMKRLPRFAGVVLAGLYAFFLYKEIL